MHRQRKIGPRLVAVSVVTLFLLGMGGGLAAGHVPSSNPARSAPPAAVPIASAAPRWVAPLATPSPLETLATVAVGGLPQYAAYDAANGDLYVPNWANSNVSVISGTKVVATLPAGSIPFSATYDPVSQDVYVVNEASNNLTVYHGTSVVGSVSVGSVPQFASYDSANGFLYVSNSGSASVTVVNGMTVMATVPVGTDPSRPVPGGTAGGGGGGGWDPAVGASPAVTTPIVYVPNTGSNNVTIIGGTSGTTIVGTVAVGSNPQFGAWDPSNVWFYVPNNNSSNVSVLSDVTPYKVLYSITVGTHPFSAMYNASTTKIFVVNYGSDNISVFGPGASTSVVATIPVGSGPEFIAQDPPPWNLLVVPNTRSDNVSVISGTSVVETLPAGSFPVIGTVNPHTGAVYVQNFESSNVTVLAPTPSPVTVKFQSHNLPPGSAWSVTAGSPPTVHPNTTVGAKGIIPVGTSPGVLAYTISGPGAYGVEKVTGPGAPSQTSANVSANETIQVTFGLLEPVTFNETGLANGSVWGIALHSSLAHGGPAAPTPATKTVNGTNGTSIVFTLVQGSWKFTVTHPSTYAAAPPKGGVGVPAHAVTRLVKFRLITSVVLLVEHGLARGTRWGYNVTGPMDARVNGTGAALKVRLESGNYTFVVWTVRGETAAPASGNLTVTAPHPLRVLVNYTRSPPPIALGPVVTGAGGSGTTWYAHVGITPSSSVSTSQFGLKVTNASSVVQPLNATAGGGCTVGAAYTAGTTCQDASGGGWYAVLTNATGTIVSIYTSGGWSNSVTISGGAFALNIISSTQYDGHGYTLTAFGTGPTTVSGSVLL